MRTHLDLAVRCPGQFGKRSRCKACQVWERLIVKTPIHFKTEAAKIALTLLMACWIATFPARLSSQPTSALPSSETALPSELHEGQDPNKPASELNHHLAGYALIAIGLLVLASQSSERLRPLQLVWPFLFVAAGVFLATWSDIEIWPRGNLSWRWLVHHDLEARQHKILAILLIAIGLVEYCRVGGKLSGFWRIWAFPLLALFGVGFLLFHDHGGASGASSPEAHNYIVPWLVEGKTKADMPQAATPKDPAPAMHHHMMMTGGSPSPETQQTQMPATEHEDTEMHPEEHGHQHHMTMSMLKVQREHMWFALIGAFVIIFKTINDSSVWRRSVVPVLWPICIVVLGMLLVLYTE